MTTPAGNPRVITVTLNPTLDRTITVQFLAIGYLNRAVGQARLDPAGRGVSISRALHLLGVPTHAIILIGHDATGRAYEALLAEEQFPITILRRSGTTRGNIILKDIGHQNETRIWDGSEGVTEDDLRRVVTTLTELIEPGDRVVFAGTLPEGVRTDAYAWLTSVAQNAGAAVFINAGGGEPLRQALQSRPRLIYLTQSQAEGLFNIPTRAYEDVIACANKLRDLGAQRVLIMMDKRDHAVIVAEEGTWIVDFPDIEPGTRSGQAEALIAGYLAGRIQERSLEEALELAGAAAAYTGSQVGQEFPTLKDLQLLAEDIEVKPVESADDLPDHAPLTPPEA